jgi:ribosomal protein S18 acetylase RimI-like enzyme
VSNTSIKIRWASAKDRAAVVSLLEDTKFFRPVELKIAEEVFDDAIAKGPQGDYQSYVALDRETAVGWVCYGATPCTIGTFDIYWIAVSPKSQGKGIGALLMDFATDLIKKQNGRIIVVETSGNERYISTRHFYEKLGYTKAAQIAHFYADGDDKVIYIKKLEN